MTRPSAAARGYGARWQRERLRYLDAHPLCVLCAQIGRVTAAGVVDHIVPHRGDPSLMWRRSNWQALCTHCHNAHKQRVDKSGHLRGSDVTGRPLDPLHPWNIYRKIRGTC